MNKPTLQSINLSLENCATIKIPAKYIMRLEMGPLEPNTRISIEDGEVRTENYFHSNYAFLKVRKNDLKKCQSELDGMDAVTRLTQSPDIVDIDLVYSDGTSQIIYMPWDGEENNDYQHSFVETSKLATIDDYKNLSQLGNNPEEIKEFVDDINAKITPGEEFFDAAIGEERYVNELIQGFHRLTDPNADLKQIN